MKKVVQGNIRNMTVCQSLVYRIFLMWMSLLLVLFLSVKEGESFSNGAPMSACTDDMIPRHGFSPQQGSPPAEVVMDQEEMTPDMYLRVTIRSRTAFKGFLLRAESRTESHLGTWYIPYLADSDYLSESQYLHCGELLQSAVTHSGRTNNIWVVSFQWRPPIHFTGHVTFRATVVESYRVYWTNISSSKILVIPGDGENNFINGRTDERTSEKKVIMDRSDMLGDYELVSDDDYHDMEGSDSRTISDRQEFQGFTVLPILENVIKDQDNPDQTDGNSHDTVNENESIDSSLVAHEISEEQTTEVPSRLSKGKSSENPRNRPSILITPPARPRNKKVSSTFATTSTTTSTATTPTPTPTSSTTNCIKNEMTSKMSPTTTTTKKLSVTTSKTVSKKIEGGIIVNARRRNLSPRPILEPKFIFTTEASTEQTTTTAVKTSLLTTIQETSSSAIETSTTIEDILTAENTMFSHVFELTKETHENNDTPAETQTEIVFHSISNSSNDREVQYNVHLEKEKGKPTVKSSIPSFDDLEVISKMISTTKSSLSSDLYEVKYNENATETILMGEITELERMPRDNLDNLEPLEGAYKRLEAQYGGWEKSRAGKVWLYDFLMLTSIATIVMI